MSGTSITLISVLFSAIIPTASTFSAPPPDQVRRALADLRDDRVPNNCEHATEWLYKFRDELKSDLVDELYKTDWQGRDAICHLLWNTSSFQPDERFIRQTLYLLRNDEILGNAQEASTWLAARGDQIQPLLADEIYKTDDQGRHQILALLSKMKSFSPDERFVRFLAMKMVESDTNDVDWKFVYEHFDAFEPLLADAISKNRNGHHDMYFRWATAWVMKKRGVLDRYANLFTPAVMNAAAIHLRADNESSNAGWAVRFFLLLGDRSLPTLRDVARSGDAQARSLANAVIDGLSGSRKAFGYLQARVELTRTPFGPEVADPDWLAQAAEPYRQNGRMYDGR